MRDRYKTPHRSKTPRATTRHGDQDSGSSSCFDSSEPLAASAATPPSCSRRIGYVCAFFVCVSQPNKPMQMNSANGIPTKMNRMSIVEYESVLCHVVGVSARSEEHTS